MIYAKILAEAKLMHSEWNILSITDPHFADQNNRYRDDNKSGIAWVFREEVFPVFHAILKDGFPDQAFDLIAVPGDVTTHGKAEGFDKFRNETAPILKTKLKSGDSKAMCLTPGNHDVTWALEPSESDYFDKKFADYSNLVQQVGATSSLTPKGSIPSAPEGALNLVSPPSGPLFIDDASRIVVLCINSSIRCGEIDVSLRDKLQTRVDTALNYLQDLDKKLEKSDISKGKVLLTKQELENWKDELLKRVLFDVPHVTQAQLLALRREIVDARRQPQRKDCWQSYLKIGILHHHLVPFPRQVTEHKPFELLSDAAKVLALLADFNFDMVLTGHKHQRYEFPYELAGKHLLIVGGPTVGGYPSGPPQGFRHIRVQRNDSETQFQIADLSLEMGNDYEAEVDKSLKNAKSYTLSDKSRKSVRVEFPPLIEKAIVEQIYSRPFYKTDVVFHVECDEVGPDYVRLTTELSYWVTNRTSATAVWHIQYDFTRAEGEVIDVEIDRKSVSTGSIRKVDIPYTLGPFQPIWVKVKVKERYKVQDDEFYTSYNPASDLKVVLDKIAAGLAFEMESFADGDSRKIPVNGGNSEIEIRNGLLPYQGVKLSWNRSKV
jgi:3',5'-cyclic AMP phosphodiesterase CpdA